MRRLRLSGGASKMTFWANGEAKLIAGAKLLEEILGLDLRPIDPRGSPCAK